MTSDPDQSTSCHNHHGPLPASADGYRQPVAPLRTKRGRPSAEPRDDDVDEHHHSDEDDDVPQSDARRNGTNGVDENDNKLPAAETDDVTDSDVTTDNDDSSRRCKTLSLSNVCLFLCALCTATILSGPGPNLASWHRYTFRMVMGVSDAAGARGPIVNICLTGRKTSSIKKFGTNVPQAQRMERYSARMYY